MLLSHISHVSFHHIITHVILFRNMAYLELSMRYIHRSNNMVLMDILNYNGKTQNPSSYDINMSVVISLTRCHQLQYMHRRVPGCLHTERLLGQGWDNTMFYL